MGLFRKHMATTGKNLTNSGFKLAIFREQGIKLSNFLQDCGFLLLILKQLNSKTLIISSPPRKESL